MLETENNSKQLIINSDGIFPVNLNEEDVVNISWKSIESSNSKQIKVISFSANYDDEPIFGLSGDYFVLVVNKEIDEEAECSSEYFVKSLPLNYPMERNRVENLKLFDREKALYILGGNISDQNLNSKFEWQPKCYFVNDNFFILDNIKKVSYESLNSANITPDLIKVCLGHIAQMHADNIVLEIEQGSNYIPKDSSLRDVLLEIHDPWVETGVAAIQALALKDARNNSEERQKFIKDELMQKINTIFDLLNTKDNNFKTICHCDLRPKNIFIKIMENDEKKKIQCKFVDFQQARYLPPIVDVLLFLYYNQRKPLISDELVLEYVGYYYEQLKDFCREQNVELEKHLPQEDFNATLDRYKIVAIFMRALHAPFLCDLSYAKKLRREDIEKYIQNMSVNRMEMIESLCEKDTSNELFIYESYHAVIEYFYKES